MLQTSSLSSKDTSNEIELYVVVVFNTVIVGVSYKTNLNEVHTASFTIGGYYKGFQLYYVFDLFTSDKKNGSWSNELSLIYTMPTKKECLCPVTYW